MGKFKKGNTPWNKNKKGIHLSPSSEFDGSLSLDKHPKGTGGVHKMAHDCTYIMTESKVRKRRPRVVWEAAYGALPKGYVIYHKDGDRYNDDLDNLEAITRAQLIKRNRNLPED